MHDIVGIGASVYDTLIVTDSYPAEDTKMYAKGITKGGGGPCGTGLVAASKLGARCAYIGVLADDEAGRFLLSDFEKYGVGTQHIEIKCGGTSYLSYVLINKKTATRTCILFKDDLPTLTITQNQADAIQNARLLMVDGNELEGAIAGAKAAKGAGVKVLYDAGGLYKGVERLLPLTDIIIPSEEFALRHTGMKTAEQAAAALFELYRPSVVVITQGKEGGICCDGESIKSYPAFSVPVADTNGAGDVFHGAFAFAQVKGYSYYKSCIFSSAVSAIKCTRIGARKAAPVFREVVKFLRREGYEF